MFYKKYLTIYREYFIISDCKVFHFYRGGRSVAKNMDVSFLFDFYGEMLTDKQRNMIDLYYNQDLSLSEIAEIVGISRQGVRDSVKRAETMLLDMEAHLGMAARLRDMQHGLEAIVTAAEGIGVQNSEIGGPATITEQASRIAALANALIAMEGL